jgi:hypothetical protein
MLPEDALTLQAHENGHQWKARDIPRHPLALDLPRTDLPTLSHGCFLLVQVDRSSCLEWSGWVGQFP